MLSKHDLKGLNPSKFFLGIRLVSDSALNFFGKQNPSISEIGPKYLTVKGTFFVNLGFREFKNHSKN